MFIQVYLYIFFRIYFRYFDILAFYTIECFDACGPPWGCTSLVMDLLLEGVPLWGWISLRVELLESVLFGDGSSPWRCGLFGGGALEGVPLGWRTSLRVYLFRDGFSPWRCGLFKISLRVYLFGDGPSPWGCTSLVMDLFVRVYTTKDRLEGGSLWWWIFPGGFRPSPPDTTQKYPTSKKSDKANRRWIVLRVFCNIVRFLVLGVLCLFLRSPAAMPNMTRRKTQERKAKHLLFWERFESIFVLLSPCRCSPAVQKRSAKNWLDYKQKGAKKRKGGLQALLLLFFACLGSCALSFALQPRRQKKTAPGGFGTHILGTTSQSILLTFLFNKGLVEMVVVKRPACFHRSFVLWWTWQPWTKAKRSEWQTTRLQQASRWQPKTKICLHHAACRGTSSTR